MGNYFVSKYFFDVLGMVYRFPQFRLTFDSVLVAFGQQHVPVIMYPLTLAFFMTYHTVAIVLLRRLNTSRFGGMILLFPIAVLALAYFTAWIETFAMVNPLMQAVFYYQDKFRMLWFGSALYACYLAVSFPIFYFLDEKPAHRWSLLHTIAAGLSCTMLTLFLLDLLTGIIGPIYSNVR
jgi:cycloeucalenol cycloisomerase